MTFSSGHTEVTQTLPLSDPIFKRGLNEEVIRHIISKYGENLPKRHSPRGDILEKSPTKDGLFDGTY